MQAEQLTNKIAVFFLPGTVQKGVAIAAPLIGQVISAEEKDPSQPGSIPDCRLMVRGRSGKTMAVSLVDTRASFYDTWAEALDAAAKTQLI